MVKTALREKTLLVILYFFKITQNTVYEKSQNEVRVALRKALLTKALSAVWPPWPVLSGVWQD